MTFHGHNKKTRRVDERWGGNNLALPDGMAFIEGRLGSLSLGGSPFGRHSMGGVSASCWGAGEPRSRQVKFSNTAFMRT